MKTHGNRIAGVMLASFAFFFVAPLAHAHPPRARELSVTVQSVQLETRTLVVIPTADSTPREYAWTKSTQFVENNRFVDASPLKEGAKAKIYYHTPFFGKPYVSKVVWLTESPPSQKK